MIRIGDLILVHGDGFIPREIEDVTKSSYSHVAGIVKENELIEAQSFRKTGYQALDYYQGHADVFTCDTATDRQRQLIVEYINEQIGTHYDYLLLAWEASRYLLKWVWPYRERKRRICSTLWADAYRYAGIDLYPGVLYPTPSDLSNSPLLRKIGSL